MRFGKFPREFEGSCWTVKRNAGNCETNTSKVWNARFGELAGEIALSDRNVAEFVLRPVVQPNAAELQQVVPVSFNRVHWEVSFPSFAM